ncbi:MAG TPA: uridine diphosphate-N-acetylglucosamine-binding protein YvcK [Acidimicrobiales bacterium]|nr:uridine diphosphate-N-acetylglucosamine-binding protein YvcK [Acidimicrobiales bacterium]
MTRVVAVGGGHGTAVTLRAARRYADEVTAIVSVADDGGSTGRLRAQLDVVALGDLRKCLVALARDGSVLARAFEHRFADGDLAGHAVGNVVLAGMVEAAGGLVAGIDETAALLGAAGRVLPATVDRVVLKAVGGAGEVNGQVAVSNAGRIERVSLVPADCDPPADALDAIAAADQIVVGPGSLYTSVLAAVAVEGIARAIAEARAQRVYVCNLRPQVPETQDYDVADHLRALARHGVEVDAVLWDPSSPMALGEVALRVLARPLAGRHGLVHDPGKLASALSDLLAPGAAAGAAPGAEDEDSGPLDVCDVPDRA